MSLVSPVPIVRMIRQPPDSVPAAGRRVLIQRNGNVAIDCTDEVHPEVAHLVSLAARTVGLDIAVGVAEAFQGAHARQ